MEIIRVCDACTANTSQQLGKNVGRNFLPGESSKGSQSNGDLASNQTGSVPCELTRYRRIYVPPRYTGAYPKPKRDT